MNREANASNENAGRNRANARGTDQATSRADGDHDEHHFQSFQHDGLEARQSSEPIKPRFVEVLLLAQLRRLRRVDFCFIVEGDNPCGAHPATAPSPAGRQPRTVPTASTIVSASTASTSELRNAAEMAGAATVQVIISPILARSYNTRIRVAGI